MNSQNFSIEEEARVYMKAAFPRASQLELDKMIRDWTLKVEDSRMVFKDFEKRVGNPSGKSILDYGSGSGGVSIAFAENGARMKGVEVDSRLVGIAEQHVALYDLPHKPEFLHYDGRNLPFPNESFDAVISISVLEHVTDPVRYIAEASRVLKPEGHFYLAFPNRLWPKETHTQLWGITYLPVWLARRVVVWLKRSPMEDNNLHFYTYWSFKKILKRANSVGTRLHVIKEEGETKHGMKFVVKRVLAVLGISYKAFLPHVMLILIKE
jgi:ubiquinone/menaquinone biosynthesis C-methylase UbiE